MAASPAAFARLADPEVLKSPVVPVGKAGWHAARRREVPPIVVLHRLPADTPELRPAEPPRPPVRRDRPWLAPPTGPHPQAVKLPAIRQHNSQIHGFIKFPLLCHNEEGC